MRDTHFILTVSNDAWFGDSIAPQQHMQMARMRAIENAKPLMRATNNGISALVNQRGEIYQQLPQFIRAELTGHIIRPELVLTFLNPRQLADYLNMPANLSDLDYLKGA